MSDRTKATVARPHRQIPAMALGVLLVIGGGLGVALWSSSQSERTIVLAAARTLEPGDVVQREDLRAVSVALDDTVPSMPDTALADLVGSTVRNPIEQGTIVGAGMFGDSQLVPDGFALVGAVLDPGRYPSSGLRSGDRVVMIHTTTAGPVRLGESDVFAVQHNAAGTDLFVSLLVPDGLVVDQATAAAAAQDLSLVEVAG